MKIVHIVTQDSYGAGRAAIRISEALNNAGQESKVCVIDKQSDAKVVNLGDGFKNKLQVKIYNKLNNFKNRKIVKDGYFQVEKYGRSFSEVSEIKDADIIHIHWINDGFWSESFWNHLLKLKKPIVCTLHDMWHFTGGCHYDNYCNKYVEGCNNCPMLIRPADRDASYNASIQKIHYFCKSKMLFVGCSSWITNEFNKSYIAKQSKKSCICIPNSICDRIFKKNDKYACREILNLPKDKKLILFGALASTSDARKGYDHIKEALKILDSEKYELVLFGSEVVNDFDGFTIHNMGYIRDDLHLALLYGASDCFVAPSIQENLANTVMESLSCGTPAVAFNIGGMPDMIKHRENGYLAEAFSEKDLAYGIQYCIDNCDTLGEKAVSFVRNSFSEARVADLYIKAYKSML